VNGTVLRAARPLFHLSETREAWILRGVGRWVGPVLVERTEELAPAEPSMPGAFRRRGRRFER
jgi:hypothetical protein